MFANKNTSDGCKLSLDTQRRASQDYVAGGHFWIAVGYWNAIIDGESIYQHRAYIDFLVGGGFNELPMRLMNSDQSGDSLAVLSRLIMNCA